MNESEQSAIRNQIKNGLAQLDSKDKDIFRRMYQPESLVVPINDVVDAVPEETLKRALDQVEMALSYKLGEASE